MSIVCLEKGRGNFNFPHVGYGIFSGTTQYTEGYTYRILSYTYLILQDPILLYEAGLNMAYQGN